jgi:redox-sensitive bicupin YhaK (pirin superfamily)
MEGAGVRLKRVLGFYEQKLIDPFLLFDHFGSRDPADYIAGFPWHPHRGIETVTYMLEGRTEHGDSMGNRGVIGPGDVQWMTAGSGIIHQEMPLETPGGLRGFQLWVNLPKAGKMMAPRYRDVQNADIPAVEAPEALVRVVAGKYGNATGPVADVVAEPLYLDVALGDKRTFTLDTPAGHTFLAYIFEGRACFGDEASGSAGTEDEAGTGILFGDGGGISVRAGDGGARFLLFGGKPLGEPIAWRGPIVMNTREELDQAFRELHAGTFIK